MNELSLSARLTGPQLELSLRLIGEYQPGKVRAATMSARLGTDTHLAAGFILPFQATTQPREATARRKINGGPAHNWQRGLPLPDESIRQLDYQLITPEPTPINSLLSILEELGELGEPAFTPGELRPATLVAQGFPHTRAPLELNHGLLALQAENFVSLISGAVQLLTHPETTELQLRVARHSPLPQAHPGQGLQSSRGSLSRIEAQVHALPVHAGNLGGVNFILRGLGQAPTVVPDGQDEAVLRDWLSAARVLGALVVQHEGQLFCLPEDAGTLRSQGRPRYEPTPLIFPEAQHAP